jgi:phosphopantetheinyl transferase
MLNFYNLWTIKESVIKLNLAGIDDLEKVKIKSLEKKEIFIERLKFDFEIY